MRIRSWRRCLGCGVHGSGGRRFSWTGGVWLVVGGVGAGSVSHLVLGLPELADRVREGPREGAWLAVREAERAGEVAERLAAPRCDVRLAYAGDLFQELEHRGVVELLGGDVAADAPRRDHERRHADAAADRPVRRSAHLDELTGRPRRRKRRRDVVEQPIVLVVVDDEHGLRPEVPVLGDGVELRGEEVRAGRRKVRRVLALTRGGEDPRDGREPVVLRVPLEPVGRVDRQRVLVQRAAGRRVLVVREPLERVGPVVVLLLIDAPADTGFRQALGVGRPGVRLAGEGAGDDIGGDRAAAGALGVDHPGHEVHPVRPRRPEQRAVIGVAQSERLGEREVERDVLALVVAHRVQPVGGAVRGQVSREPHVVAGGGRAADRDVDRLVLDGPRVRGRGDRLRARGVGVEVPGQQIVGRRVRVLRVVLVEDRLAVGGIAVVLDLHVRVTEPAHAGERPEVVIERAVLLHVDDNVLDVGYASAAGTLGRGAGECRRQQRGCEHSSRTCGGGAEKATAGNLGHEGVPLLGSASWNRASRLAGGTPRSRRIRERTSPLILGSRRGRWCYCDATTVLPRCEITLTSERRGWPSRTRAPRAWARDRAVSCHPRGSSGRRD